jgi:hypothetical protein
MGLFYSNYLITKIMFVSGGSTEKCFSEQHPKNKNYEINKLLVLVFVCLFAFSHAAASTAI